MSALSPRVSLIITTYNRPDALAAVLRALDVQTHRDFEVLIADDGSAEPTRAMLAGRHDQLHFPLRHVWQEDQGFRAARARNLAVAASRGEYLVFLDGDCLPFPDFLANHLRLAEAGWFVSGNRVMLPSGFTERVLAENLRVELWNGLLWLRARAAGDVPRLLPLIRFRSRGFKWFSRRRWYGAKSCNLALWRSDFFKVDGFDESYAGWGHEDADLAARLIGSGVLRKSGRFAVPVLHLWHPHSDRSGEPHNLARLQETLDGRRTKALQGVSAHLASSG